MPDLEMEVWESNTRKTEMHFYVKGTDTWVAGFNVEFFSRDKMEEILKDVDVNDIYFRKPK